MSDVILTVSGSIDPLVVEQAQQKARPRLDYLGLARALQAELFDYQGTQRTAGLWGKAVAKIAGRNALLAWSCFSRRNGATTIISDGEQVGIPLALLLKWLGRGSRDVRHVMIAHAISARKKAFFFDWLRVASHVDTFLVYSSAQKQIIETRFGVPAERVVLIPFQVDTQFYSAEAAAAAPSEESQAVGPLPLICAVGLERRDYRTLLRAVDGLPVRLVITASSAWSKQVNTAEGETIPSNVTVRTFSYAGLRQLYQDAAFMVMPLLDVDFAAGVTAILEAMAMGRAVICSRALGQTDLVSDGETGVYVDVGDVEQLRAAITRLLDDPAEAHRLGHNGRTLVRERMSLERYVERFEALLRGA